MENDDFYKSFMTGVKNGVPSAASSDSVKKNTRKTALIVAAIIVGMIVVVGGVVGGVVALVALNNSNGDFNDEEADDAEVSEEEIEETPAPNSAGYYSSTGKLIAIRMACLSETKEYQFYKDNTYEITPTEDDKLLEEGTYKIENGNIVATIKYGTERTLRMLKDNKLMDVNLTLECEEYDDF